MDTKQMQIEKEKAENQICDVLNEFMQKTGLTVDGLRVSRLNVIMRKDENSIFTVQSVRIEVKE